MKPVFFLAITLLWVILPDPCLAQEQKISEAENIFASAQQLYYEGQYQKAADRVEKASILFEKLNHIPGIVKSLNLRGENFSGLNQCDKALEILNRSLKLATKLPTNHPELAQTYYYLSRATGVCARKIDDAIRLMRQSINLKKKLYGAESLEISYDYTVMGYLFDNKELPDSAFSYLNKALAIREKKLQPDDPEIAYTLHTLAQVYENQSELSKSLERHLRALKIRQTKLVESHPATLHSINATGSVYRKFGNFDRALDYYQYALENRKKTLGENHSDVSCSYYSIANLYKDMFDYHSAIQYYLQGHRILENLYGVNTDILPAYYAVTAKMYGKIGEHQMALAYINKAEATAEKNLGKDHPFRGISYNYIGDYYGEINDLPRQTEYFKRAITIFQKAYGAGSVREGDILFTIGSVSAKNGRFAEALTLYQKTLGIFESKMGKKNPKTASVFHAMGDVRRDQHQFEEALELFQKAFVSISTSLKDSTDLYVNPRPDELEGKFLALQIAGSKGQTLFEQAGSKKNDPQLMKQSLITYEFAMQLIDHISADYNNENAKIELEKESRKIYAQALQAAYTLYEHTKDRVFLEKAFAISEKSRFALLRENIMDNKAKTLAGVPDSLIVRERDTKIELAYYRNELYQARKDKQPAKIQVCEKNIFEAQQKYDNLKEKLEREFPVYYNFKYNIRTASISELQNLLTDQNTVAVEFFAGDSSLYVFSVTKSRVQLERKKLDTEFWNLFRDYEKSLTYTDFILNSSKEADKLYIGSAYLLYEFLLGSTFDFAGNTIEKLILIPDDALAQFNFGTLITKKPDSENQDYKTMDYLIGQCRISYAYSLAFIKNDVIRMKRSKYGFAGFAPSYSGNRFADLDTALHPLAYRIFRDGNLPLPGAEEEVKYLSSFMDGKSWLNTEATETNFKQHAGDYNILHLAMHSLLNNENPEYSELLFNHETDEWNDGYLKVSEIYNLHLNAELVVLSACSSGYGKIQKGEGPISISRAFSYAGCPSVVMSLWKVPDEVTRQVMTYFYQELKNGESKDEALRLAQLKFVNETQDPLHRHPHFWAGFVVMGDTGPLSSPWSLWIIIGIGLFSFAVTFLILKRRRTHTRTSGSGYGSHLQ